MKIGFIGLGIMGKPMSKNLVKAGYELVVYNRSKASVEELVAMGAAAGESAADVAAQCDVIITMLPNSPQVRGKSVIGLALAMAAGLQLTHCLVPPTPGPTTAASMLGVDVGQMIFLGALISIPMLIVAVFYCKSVGKKIYQIPTENGGFDRKEFRQEYIKSMDELDKIIGEKELPSLGMSIAPLVIPLGLILTQTVCNLAGVKISLLAFVGDPIIALAIGTLIAI